MSRATARKITLTETAKLVRAALKAAYPTVTFSVRCSRYSMGCSIDVSWTDGPTQAQVQPMLNHFDSKSFDGMDDSTHYHTQQLNGEEVDFEADYVTGQRTISPAFLAVIAAKVATKYGLPIPPVLGNDHGHIAFQGQRVPSTRFANQEEDLSDAIHHVAHSTSALPKPRIRIMADVREV